MKINKRKCISCGLCEAVCIRENIDVKNYSFGDDCFFCYHCMAVCPKGAISDDEKISPEIKPYKIKPENFENLIYNKRSCRNYKDKEIPLKELKKIAEFLRFSPTGTNTQKLHITILGSKKKVKELSGMIMRSFRFKQKLLLLLFPFIILAVGYKKIRIALKMKKFMDKFFSGDDILSYNAPALFIFHQTKESSTPEQDGVIASTIGTLYAETLGFASCFNGFMVYGINFSGRIKKMLGIPKKHKVYSAFLLGYPKYKFSRRVLRDEAKYKILF